MKLEVFAKVVGNKIVGFNRKEFAKRISIFNGKDIILSVTRKKKTRSNNQNRYYWGCVIPIIKDAIDNSIGESSTNEDIHHILKCKFNSKKIVNESTGEVLEVPMDTKDLITTDFEVYMNECRRFASEFFDIYIPEPNEQTNLL